MRNKLLVTTALAAIVFSTHAFAAEGIVKRELVNNENIDGKIIEVTSNGNSIRAQGNKKPQVTVAVGSSQTEKITVSSKSGTGIVASYGGNVNLNADEINITGATNGVNLQDDGKININGKNIVIHSQGKTKANERYGVLAQRFEKRITTEAGVFIIGDTVSISGDGAGAILAQNGTNDKTMSKYATVEIKAKDINLSAPNGYAVSAMSNGKVVLEGNTTIKGGNGAILTRGYSQIYINKSGEHTVKMDGNINFDYNDATSKTSIDSIVDVNLVGAESYWNGNTAISYDKKPADDNKLLVSQATISLKDGATWNATAVNDKITDVSGLNYEVSYTALNNLNIDKGTVNIKDTARGIAVDNINAADATFNGGTLRVNKEMNVERELTLNNNVEGEGKINFAAGTTLNVGNSTTIANEVSSAGTIVNVALVKGDTEVQLNEIFKNAANEDKLANFDVKIQNALYKLVRQGENSSLWLVEQANTSEVAANLGISGVTAAALLAATSGNADTNENFNAISDALYEAAQAGNSSVVREASKLGADAASVARAVETSRTNMVFAAVNDELNGAGNAMAEGMSAGDYFRKAKAWIRGLFNNADYDGTSKAQGFDADTYGVAMGIDKELDNHIKAGFGYAYSQTDVNGDVRDTDVDTNTLFIYGQYKPADWYINTALAYSWSDYEEKKSVLGYNANAKYDVDTLALQSMYGFERKLGEYDLNPEFGLRYMHISQDGYTDALGSKVKSKDSDVLTAVAGAKIAKSYELESGMVLRPELKAAVTYDVVSDNNNANVMLANGAGYRVNGEKLERLGFEFGAKVATDVADNWELAAGYELRLRKDFSDNTLMLNAKYKF